ncbi:alpha/beta hydrolase family protein [Kordiimonas marina]|uniref:alpha/beta hydrolase family protein n=1 Tax=Kordiimonas marina TaxID=2872312 RepID=UPI001FF4713A|nr:alpha/beta fold hydrolase [Kordiimonas marina]MCJ9430543.1 alpha/beta fold hydrolase [Kordiimonas marina]
MSVQADPVTEDPATIDRANPPGMIELTVPSHGAQMNGHLYTANGPGPHPTVVMLHGFPGNEKNLDLAQALRRAGFNTLYFHYRGAWGSGGKYSLRHVLEDANTAVAYVREKGKAGLDRIDPTRISVVGHSLGGYAALMTGATDKAITCTVAIAPGDIVPLVATVKSKDVVATNTNEPVPGLDGYSFGDLIREARSDTDFFALVPKMTGFKGRPLMIISGDKDTVVPLSVQKASVDAAKAAGAKPFKRLIMDADHGFSWRRIALARAVVTWMDGHCR